jgi:uncharacterized protein with GYD domain
MKFVTLIRFTSQGVANFNQTTKRAKDFIKHAKASKVIISELLWTQGRYDGIISFDAPDRESAAALILGLAAHGNVQTETMPAFDMKEMEKVLSKAG